MRNRGSLALRTLLSYRRFQRLRLSKMLRPTSEGSDVMAGMVVAVRPTVLVQGVVQGVEPRAIKTGDRAGTIYKTDVTVLTSSGGQTTVEFWERDGSPSPQLPNALDRVALVVEISPPNGNFGASFGFVRYAGDNDLDLIVSSIPALAGK